MIINTILKFSSFNRYHCGSLAFGSLIIAIVQIIRAALEYLEYKLKGIYVMSEMDISILHI